MSMQNLLVELFVEELPPKALARLGEAFVAGMSEGLRQADLLSGDSQATAYASPRRLAVHLTNVLERAPDARQQQKLMPVSIGLDADGLPSPALLKKLSALGLDASAAAQLRQEGDGKAATLWLDRDVPGAILADGLQQALTTTLARLPIPKVMSYQLADGWDTVHFVRPAHSLLALHGDRVVPISALGLTAGDTTHGHRFEAAADPLRIRHADLYAEQLRTEGAVIAGFDARRSEIARQLAEAAAGESLSPIEDADLLDEVTGLVERPNVLVGQFDAAFLDVPQECLILTMKANQKYFPLLDAEGRLSNRFLIVSNIRPDDPSAVIGGNERVVRPRLADAKFFFDQDRRRTLESRLPDLDRVVYHNKLGSQGERSARVAAMAEAIGQALGEPDLAALAVQAARLAKADLLTDMVGEFPELQGVMGRYYARHDGLPAEVADAIEDHYRPRYAGDALPRHRVGLVLALADKLETLTGLFSIGQLPTGDKDPYALRRHALGVIRMLTEAALPLDIDKLLDIGLAAFPQAPDTVKPQLLGFLFDRLANALREQGYRAQEVDAVLALQPQRLADISARLAAVRAFAALPEAESLAAANKRVGNILKKAAHTVAPQVDAALFQEAAEGALHHALQIAAAPAAAAFDRGDYTASLQSLAALRAPVDAFFDTVMVNAEDPALRANRLGLLATLHQAMNRVADLSRLAG